MGQSQSGNFAFAVASATFAKSYRVVPTHVDHRMLVGLCEPGVPPRVILGLAKSPRFRIKIESPCLGHVPSRLGAAHHGFARQVAFTLITTRCVPGGSEANTSATHWIAPLLVFMHSPFPELCPCQISNRFWVHSSVCAAPAASAWRTDSGTSRIWACSNVTWGR
jgi:hypothetical protein